jgi:hypothetical protein
MGLNISPLAPYVLGMAKSRVPSPKDTLKVVRKGDTVRLTATITRVADDDDPRLRKVTLWVPGYPIPITISERQLLGEDDA